MTDDPNKKYNQQPQSGRQTGQQQNQGPEHTAQTHPAQGAHDEDIEDIDEQEEQDHTEQRRAS